MKQKIEDLKARIKELEKEYDDLAEVYYEEKDIPDVPRSQKNEMMDDLRHVNMKLLKAHQELANIIYTPKEIQVLKAITKDDFAREEYDNNLGNEVFPVWTDVLMDTIREETNLKGKELSGVISSLNQKGVMYSNEETTAIKYTRLPSVVKNIFEGDE